MSIAEKLKTIADNEQKVFDAGVKSENDRFWDAFQNFGLRGNYSNAFMGTGWTDTSFRPKYDMNATQANYMFSESGIVDLAGDLEKLGVSLDFSKCTSFQYLISNNSRVQRFPTIDLSGTSSFLNGFRYGGQLVEAKIIGGNSITDWTNAFTNCANLTNLTMEVVINGAFSVAQSSNLTHESLLSILNALNDRSASTTLICTLGSTNLAKLTDEEKAIATEKGWTLA